MFLLSINFHLLNFVSIILNIISLFFLFYLSFLFQFFRGTLKKHLTFFLLYTKSIGSYFAFGVKVMSNTDKELSISKLYKNKPLVRYGNTIYYGYLSDRFIVKIQVLSDSEFANDLQLSSEISVELLDLGVECKLPGTLVKSCTKSGLWSAIDVSSAWLERKLIS